jgi:hypothetical protein
MRLQALLMLERLSTRLDESLIITQKWNIFLQRSTNPQKRVLVFLKALA